MKLDCLRACCDATEAKNSWTVKDKNVWSETEPTVWLIIILLHY